MRIRIPKIPLKWINLKKTSRSSLVLSVLASLILFNLIFSFFPLKIDLTENKEFTLSRTTQKIIGEADDLITIKAFISENLPSRLLPVRQMIKDVLYGYEKAAPGKIRLLYIDPKNDPELVNQALGLGIPQLQFSDVQNDKFSVSRGFLGLAITFADKKAVIEVVTEETSLEHEITSAIKKITGKDLVRIGFTSGHGEELNNRNNLLRLLLEKDFEVSEVEISEKNDQSFIDEVSKILLMINPTEKFSPRARLVIDQFIMRGGSLILLQNPIDVSNNLQPSLSQTNINDLIQNYGVKINSDLVLSAESEIANFSTGYTTFTTPYPFWVRILPSGFNQGYPSIAKLDTAIFPWVSSLTTDQSKLWEGNIIDLIKTSKRSFSQTDNLNIDPTNIVEPKDDELKEISLAALIDGRLNSAAKESNEMRKSLRPGEDLLESSREKVKIVVFADSDFVSDYFIRRYKGNAALLSNTIEAVASQTGLSEIRSKSSAFRPIREIPESAKAGLKWSNILVGPTLIFLAGILRYRKRVHP